MVERAAANTEEEVSEVLADAGYRSEENFTALKSRKIDGDVPLGRRRKSVPESNDDARTADDDTATKRMQRKLRTENGRERYRRREHRAESPFGWVKNVLGFRSFSLRGSANVHGEWDLVCLALNLRRMQGTRTGKTPRESPNGRSRTSSRRNPAVGPAAHRSRRRNTRVSRAPDSSAETLRSVPVTQTPGLVPEVDRILDPCEGEITWNGWDAERQP